jgi:peptide/nickel transport system substrate-binding protein
VIARLPVMSGLGAGLDRRRFLLGAAGAAAALVGGCSPGERRRSTGAGPGPAPQGVDPATLAPTPRISLRTGGGALGFPSPFGYVAGLGYRQVSLIYDTLLWKDGSGRIIPWLASSYERSADGLTYTFDLREGASWHDGRPVTADDVAFTFDYYRRHPLGPLVVFQPSGIENVHAPSRHRVVVRLQRPDVTFAEAVAATLPVAPRHVWEPISDPAGARDLAVLVGSGPYRLTSYEGDGGPLLYEAFDGYFLGRPFVRRLEIVPVADGLTALLAGQLDAAETEVAGTRPDTLAPFRSDKFGIVEAPGGFTFPLFFNLAKGGALADVRFRRACALAVDRADVVRRLTGGNGTPGNPGFLAPTNPFHVPVEQYGFDPEAAGRLLDEAGYPRRDGEVRRGTDGRQLRFELLFPSPLAPLAEVVAAGLRVVGVGVDLRAVELGPALFGRKLGGDYEMAITLYPGPSGPGPNADPDLLRPLLSSQVAKGLNSVNGYADRELDDLAERQRATFDRAERHRLVARVQEIAARDLPVLTLYYSTLHLAYRQDVFDQWYITPSQFPVGPHNRQLFVTGLRTGTVIRPTTA